jgi:tetratricopeptide (TPR) repeat protein
VLKAHYVEAERDFTRAIELNPGLLQARYARARLYLDLYFMPISIPRVKYLDYEKLDSVFPKPSDDACLKKASADVEALRTMPGVDPEKILFLDAFQLFFRQEYVACRARLDEYLKVSPADAQAHYLKGLAAFYQNQWKDAIESFDQVVRMSPSHVSVRLYRGLAWQVQRNFAKATQDYTALRKMDLDALGPDYPMKREQLEALVCLADALSRYIGALSSPFATPEQRREGWEACLKLIDRGIELDAGIYLAHYFRARTLAQLDRFDEAVASADRAIALAPEFANAHQARGYAQFMRGIREKDVAEFRRAEEDFDRALKCYPQAVAAMVYRCLCRWNGGRVDDAVADAFEALRMNPNQFEIGEVHEVLQKAAATVSDPATYRARCADYAPSFEKAKRTWMLRVIESICHTRAGEIEPAFAKACEAFTGRPKDPLTRDLVSETARVLCDRGSERVVLAAAPDAFADLRRLLYHLVAQQRYARKDYAGAEEAATRAIEADGKFAEAYGVRGNSRSLQKKYPEAIEDFERYQKLVPARKAEIQKVIDTLKKRIDDR